MCRLFTGVVVLLHSPSVRRSLEKGIVCRLFTGVVVLLHSSSVRHDRVVQLREVVERGEEVVRKKG